MLMANVYYYLKYILEQMPHNMDGTDTGFLESMMPWSSEYREYERSCTSGIKPMAPPGIHESKPSTPKKSKHPECSADIVA